MKRLIAICVLCLSALAARADDAVSACNTNEPELRHELLARSLADQNARTALVHWLSKHGSNGDLDVDRLNAPEKAEFDRLSTAVKQADSKNTGWFKNVVDQHGWPTRSLVGQSAAHAAWLLVQHADADVPFQRRCLDLMASLPKSEVSQVDVAYLTDRVLLAEGKKQVYGTQFHTVDGKLQPRPLEDDANVDKRRATVGLPPLAQYAKAMAKIYGGGSK